MVATGLAKALNCISYVLLFLKKLLFDRRYQRNIRFIAKGFNSCQAAFILGNKAIYVYILSALYIKIRWVEAMQLQR